MLEDGRRSVSDPGKTRSVQRALALLEAVGSEPGGSGISELSARVGLPVSTVHRLLATLVDSGFVVQHPENGRYRIGLRAFQIGSAFLTQTSLAEVSRPAMRELAQQVGETVNLAVRDGFAAIYIDQIESNQMLKLFTRTGSRVALYCTGVGKVFLSSLPREDIEEYIRTTELVPRTPNTIANGDMLRSHLETIRLRGYGVDDEEFEVGVRCVAAPIYDRHGSTIAAVSVSGPSQRVTRSTLASVTDQVTSTAQKISAQLGYTPDAECAPDQNTIESSRSIPG